MLIREAKYSKQMLQQGKISEEDLNFLQQRDPTPQKKYLDWMVKQRIQKPDLNINEIANLITEYDALLVRNQILDDFKDIYKLKWEELQNHINFLNQTGLSSSRKDLESDMDILVDNEDLFVVAPYTHEASRKLGLKEFQSRASGDAAWCTTWANDGHWNSYYYSQGITFYYVWVRSERIFKALEKRFGQRSRPLTKVAILVRGEDPNNARISEGYDANDHSFSGKDLTDWLSIIGLD